MALRQLGKTNLRISPLILGTWAIGGWMWGGTNEKEALEAVQASIDHGLNTIDTAPAYGMGYSEHLIGQVIKEQREKVIIATKCGLRWDGDEDKNYWMQPKRVSEEISVTRNSKPESIIAECERSLKRLGTDYIDLYQIHWPDPVVSIEEAWQAMVTLKEQGKVRAIGVSNYSLEQLQAAQAIHPVDSLQPPYSLIRRGIEQDLLPFCQKNQISVLAYSSLERGLLTGKVDMKRKFVKGDHRNTKSTFAPEYRKQILSILDQIRPIAEKHKATLAEVILHCTFHLPGITAALVGARNRAQAIENAKTLQLRLSHDERNFIVNLFATSDLQQKPEVW